MCLRPFLAIFHRSTPRPEKNSRRVWHFSRKTSPDPAPNLQTGNWGRWGARSWEPGTSPDLLTLKVKIWVGLTHREGDRPGETPAGQASRASRPPTEETDGAPGARPRQLIGCCEVSGILDWEGRWRHSATFRGSRAVLWVAAGAGRPGFFPSAWPRAELGRAAALASSQKL